MISRKKLAKKNIRKALYFGGILAVTATVIGVSIAIPISQQKKTEDISDGSSLSKRQKPGRAIIKTGVLSKIYEINDFK